MAAKEVEQKDEVCFIRQVHLLAARVAPLVNMTVEELLSKPGMRRGGFGAQAVDPAAALVEFTNFLRITKHASDESQEELAGSLDGEMFALVALCFPRAGARLPLACQHRR